MYIRYKNEALKFKPKLPSNFLTKSLNYFKEKKFTRLKRSTSFSTSLSCVKQNYNAQNINIIHSLDTSRSGGSEYNQYITISFINYFILNRKDLVPINLKNNNVTTVQSNNNPNFIKLENYKLSIITEENIKNIYDKIIKCNSIIIKINSREFVENFNTFYKLQNKNVEDLTSEEIHLLKTIHSNKSIGHALACFKCNNKLYYYDDNANPPILEFDWISYLHKLFKLCLKHKYLTIKLIQSKTFNGKKYVNKSISNIILLN